MNDNFWKKREECEKMMEDELIRVMGIMEDHGYPMAAAVDFSLCNQYVSIETHKCGHIYRWFWAVEKRENFKAVLKWFLAHTGFSHVTAHMTGRCRIPTFYNVGDLERNYDEYFTDGWTPAQRDEAKGACGCDEDYSDGDHYCPSATAGDYGPGNPWDAPGMSIKDFI